MTKDTIWDGILLLLFVLFKHEIGAWTNFISWKKIMLICNWSVTPNDTIVEPLLSHQTWKYSFRKEGW